MSTYPVDLYDAIHRGTPGDVAFYREACRGAGSVLELGCGSGRMLSALSEPGRTLTGLDLRQDALELAREQVPEAQLVCADMRHFELDQRFDRILAPFSALYCLPDLAALTETFASAFRHLAPGGQLFADVWNADEFHEQGVLEDDEPAFLVAVEVGGKQYVVYESSRWSPERQRLIGVYDYRAADGASRVCEIEHRYFSKVELERALAEAGARSWQLYGDFAGGRWDATSELTVLAAG